MTNRCHNPAQPRYADYGGRGIVVCAEWRASVEAFASYVEESLGQRPGPLYSLDRIDNDGHYEPGNLRWADSKTQNNNRRLARLRQPVAA